jgi:hypothetical protein
MHQRRLNVQKTIPRAAIWTVPVLLFLICGSQAQPVIDVEPRVGQWSHAGHEYLSVEPITDLSRGGSPCFTFTADFPILHRPHSSAGQFLMVGDSGMLLDAGDVRLSVEGGVKLDLVLYDESGWDIEFAYLGTEDFTGVETPSDTNINFIFYNGVPADPAESYVVNYASNIHGGEFNFRYRCRPCLSVLAGIRGVQLHEQFDVLRGDDINTGLYSKTYNHLFGIQLGGDLRWWLGDVVGLTATIKAGVANNSLTVVARALDVETENLVELSYDTDKASFFGEVNVGLLIAMGRYAALRFGYQALWFDRVALAPDQNDEFDIFTNVGSPDLGTPFYHGGYVGFEFSY